MCGLSVILAVLAVANAAYVEEKHRIVGGQAVDIREYPHQVAIEVKELGHWKLACGGSVISPVYVLTAAHCYRISRASTRVRAGSSFRFHGGSVHQVVDQIVHSNYHRDGFGNPVNDLMVIEVSPPFEFGPNCQPAVLAQESAQPGQKAIITGFGQQTSGGKSPNQLAAVEVPIVSRNACVEAYEHLWSPLVEDTLCAGYLDVGGKDSCQGDSGGPLQVGGKLVGVVSFGIGCAEPSYPGIYVDLSKHRDWIRRVTGVH